MLVFCDISDSAARNHTRSTASGEGIAAGNDNSTEGSERTFGPNRDGYFTR
jgi:hypothetical protein